MKNCIICGKLNDRKISKFCSKKCSDRQQYLQNRNSDIRRATNWNKKNKNRRQEILRKEKLSAKPAFRAIKQRCEDRQCSSFKYYGGKGVKCLFNFQEFKNIYLRTDRCELCDCLLNDENRNDSNGRCIDRIDNDGNYQECNIQIICRSCNIKKDKNIFTDDQKEQIRNEYVKYSKIYGTVALSKKYKVSQETIWRIVNHHV
jgi:hypothetical protein